MRKTTAFPSSPRRDGRPPLRGLALSAGVLASLAGGSAVAQPVRLGGEFQVNSQTTGNELDPDVARNAAGDFVVAWVGNSDPAGDPSDIRARRFDSAGDPVGDELAVNTYTPGNQNGPRVGIGDQGEIVVVWESFEGAAESEVRSRSYDSAGQPLGGELEVNSYTTGSQRFADVAMGPDGRYVVVWESRGGADDDAVDIRARGFAPGGGVLIPELQVNQSTAYDQVEPAVAITEDLGFVVVWGDYSDGDANPDIKGRRFDSAGGTDGPDFQVNTLTTSYQVSPALAADGLGGFVVAWRDRSGADGDDRGIRARRFDSAGTPTLDFPVNETYTAGVQSAPAVAASPEGFLITWESVPDTDVQGRLFGPSGDPVGADFVVNTATAGTQVGSAVAMDVAGESVVAWTDQNGPERVLAQRFATPLAIFFDGFETGDTCGWSTVTHGCTG